MGNFCDKALSATQYLLICHIPDEFLNRMVYPEFLSIVISPQPSDMQQATLMHAENMVLRSKALWPISVIHANLTFQSSLGVPGPMQPGGKEEKEPQPPHFSAEQQKSSSKKAFLLSKECYNLLCCIFCSASNLVP